MVVAEKYLAVALAVLAAQVVVHIILIKNLAIPEVATVATAVVQMEVLVKAPLPVNLENLPAICMHPGGVARPVELRQGLTTQEMAAIVKKQAALASLSSASIRRRQHEIRNRN